LLNIIKNSAAHLPYGGGKSGICASNDKLSGEERETVISEFAKMIHAFVRNVGTLHVMLREHPISETHERGK
jgi:glutamate dehydrogenase/leucine dehydrogenase